MVIKVYISGISASKEVKKRQQRALLLLDSAQVTYEQVDITEPGREDERERIQEQIQARLKSANDAKSEENGDKPESRLVALPPQFFNGDDYCGDYEAFNLAVDVNQLYPFLKLETPKSEFTFEELPKPTETNGSVQRNEAREEVLSEDLVETEVTTKEHYEEEVDVDEIQVAS